MERLDTANYKPETKTWKLETRNQNAMLPREDTRIHLRSRSEIAEPRKIKSSNGNPRKWKRGTFKKPDKTLLKRRILEMPQSTNHSIQTTQNRNGNIIKVEIINTLQIWNNKMNGL